MDLETRTPSNHPSRKALWAGRVISGLAVLFLALDAAMKVLMVAPAVRGTIQVGYPVSVVFGLGVTLALCVTTYAVPRTAPLGAILLTGYLGGAVATHVRIGDPLLTHTLFPVYMGALIWAGLLLRDRRLRGLLPVRRPARA